MAARARSINQFTVHCLTQAHAKQNLRNPLLYTEDVIIITIVSQYRYRITIAHLKMRTFTIGYNSYNAIRHAVFAVFAVRHAVFAVFAVRHAVLPYMPYGMPYCRICRTACRILYYVILHTKNMLFCYPAHNRQYCTICKVLYHILLRDTSYGIITVIAYLTGGYCIDRVLYIVI